MTKRDFIEKVVSCLFFFHNKLFTHLLYSKKKKGNKVIALGKISVLVDDKTGYFLSGQRYNIYIKMCMHVNLSKLSTR